MRLDEIRNIGQKTKEIKATVGASWKPSYIYTEVITTILLINNDKIKLTSISQNDFNSFYKAYRKVKSGEAMGIMPTNKFSLHLLEIYYGFFWLLIVLFLAIGLGIGLYTS